MEYYSNEKPDLESLMHYGRGHKDGGHSGRYPWGSGDDGHQREYNWLDRVNALKKQGKTEKEICELFGLSSTEYRAYYGVARADFRHQQAEEAHRLRYEEGLSLAEGAKRMGFANDSSFRALLNEYTSTRSDLARDKAEYLKARVDKYGMIDVGAGVERDLNISTEKLNQSLSILEAEGYHVYGGRVPQATSSDQMTILRVLTKPETAHKEIFEYDKIHTAVDYNLDDVDVGKTSRQGFVYPESMDPSRLKIRYAEEGGIERDGLVQIRRGVPDLDLGDSNYAQVRILVDGTHYIKGMAAYGEDRDFPEGCDVIFNTNKHVGKPVKEVLKEIKDDPENPFGSAIKEKGGQSYYIGEDGEKHLSLINKRADQGDWGDWQDTLASQFLSKQPLQLAKKQLKIAEDDKQAEFDDIMSLTNPTVKKVMLEKFAEDCDGAAVDLKAASIPGQKFQVILPVSSLKDTEIYAPNFNDGDTVALVRYPHGGLFEIPILKVNNKNKEGRNMIGTGENEGDAVGINSKVAERLSGADFDGDTVMVIPCNNDHTSTVIKNKPPLKDLEGFDNKALYGPDSGSITSENGQTYATRNGVKYRIMKDGPEKGKQMGMITNLITDMTVKGASDEEIARAVKHSMVVIDAPKHKLDYKASELDNGIAELKRKWQGTYDEETGKIRTGASTIFSRAKSPKQVLKRKGKPWVDEETGEVLWERINPKTGEYESKYVVETYKDKNGKEVTRTIDVPWMEQVKDARELSSGTRIEDRYADYANKMKSLANRARKEAMAAGKVEYSAEANKTYEKEVAHLNAQLNESYKNAPKERWAQLQAAATVKERSTAYKDSYGEKMPGKDKRKIGQQALNNARLTIGASRKEISINEREWEAIQAGAISESKLRDILNRADIDKVREYATPKTRKTLSPAKMSRIESMYANGRTTAEIAQALGVSTSTVSKYLSK